MRSPSCSAGTTSRSSPSRACSSCSRPPRTPKSIASGERAVMVDGNEYNMFIEIDAKSPVKIIYPKEGTPFVHSPTAIFADAPHPNAARVLQNFLYTAKVQQLLVNEGGAALGAPGREGARGPHAALADQAACRRSGRNAAADRRHQEDVHGAVRQLIAESQRPRHGSARCEVATPASRRRSSTGPRPFSSAMVVLLAVLVLLPMFWLLVTSLQRRREGLHARPLSPPRSSIPRSSSRCGRRCGPRPRWASSASRRRRRWRGWWRAPTCPASGCCAS